MRLKLEGRGSKVGAATFASKAFGALMFGAVMFASAALGSGCAEESKRPGEEVKDIPRVIGGERPARLYVPSDYDPARSYPLVLMLHGFGVNGTLQNVVFQLVERVDQYQFVLVVPDGTKNANGQRFWNAFLDCCSFLEDSVDDVSYLSGLVEEARSVVSIDDDRVTALGHSNGGYMSFRLACERPDMFRRVVSVAGSMPVDPDTCVPTQSVSILHIHGTADDTVPYYDNRGTEGGAGHGIITRGAEATVGDWLALNHCDHESMTTRDEKLMTPGTTAETTVSSWLCEEGSTVSFWSIDGGDHLLLSRNSDFQDQIAVFVSE